MGKKIFISFLVLTFLNLIGCYSVSEVTKEEFLKTKNSDISVLTYDLERYNFKSGNYDVKDDTLNGIGSKEIPALGTIPFKGSIPMDKISAFQAEYLDGLKTSGLVLLIAGIGFLIVGVLIAAALGDALSGG